MTVLLTPHPSADQLRAFGLGQLPPADADAIERHVSTCDSCCHILEDATDNSFEHRLRQAHQETVHPGIPPELAEHPRYRVLELVGQGGMGAVYRAEHRHMQRPVALKVLKPQLIRSPALVHRFHQEVRAAARLQHPNIVTAYDADEASGLHFLVMEYVEGRSLAELVRAGPLPVAEACALVRQAALGLQHAHEQGMVHRDVKPHNLMVTAAGQVKILDFGLARLAEGPEDGSSPAAAGAAPLTGAGAVMGTADYIAPEQAADPRSADIRADIYSLGCTLYHLLTGQPPFPDGTDQDKIARHTNGTVPALTGVPAALAAVVARMTARDPAQRYGTPAEVADALTPFTHSSVKEARKRKRRPWLVALALLVAGLLSGGIALRVHTERGDIVVETDDNSLELTVRRNGQIIRIRDPHSGQTWEVDTRQYQLAVADQPDGLAIELPGRGILTLRRKGGGTVTVSTAPAKGKKPAAVRLPDAAELAKRPNGADALKREDIPREALAYLGDGDPAKAPPELVAVLGDLRLRCPGGAGQPALSPDGKLIVIPGGEKMYIFDAVTGNRLRSFAVGEGSPLDLKIALGPDSHILAVAGNDGDCELWDVFSGKQLHKLSLKDRLIDPVKPVFSPDGALVAALSHHAKRVGVWEVESGRLVLEWKGPPNPAGHSIDIVRDVAFSGDGRTVAVACIDDDLRFFERTPKGRFEEVPPDKRPVKSGSRIALSPDGRALAVYDSESRQIRLCGATGRTRFKIESILCGFLAFSPDSKVLIAARWAVGNRGDWSISRFDAATGKSLTDPEPVQIDQDAHWSLRADGKTAAVVVRDERVVRLLDVETGKQRLPGPGLTWIGHDLAFSPDGRYLVSRNTGPLQAWDLAKGRVEATWEASSGSPRVFSSDGTMLAMVYLGKGVELYRFPEGKLLRTCRGPEKGIGAVALSPDGVWVAAGGADQSIWVWRTRDGRMERVLPTEAQTEALTFSPDGRFLCATTQGDHEPYEALRIWNLQAGAEQKEPRVVEEKAVSLTFLPDGKTLAGIDRDGRVWLRDGTTGALKKTFAAPELVANDRLKGIGWRTQALSPGGHLAAVGTDHGPLVVWQPRSSPLRQRQLHLFPPGKHHVRALAFSPDGRYLAATHPDGIICLFRLSEQGKLPDLLPPKQQSTAVPLPEPAGLAKLPNAADALKREDVSREALDFLRDTGLTKVPPELVAVLGDVRLRCPRGAGPPTFSPDGKLVIVPGVLVFDAATGVRRRCTLPECGSEQKVVLSPDQRTLAVAQNGDDHFELWDFQTGKRLHRLPVQDPTWEPDAPVFSLDGKYVAASSLHTRRARVWEVGSGRLALAWNGPPNLADEEAHHVANVAFSADSRLLAIACTDDNLHFFELTEKGRFQKVPPDRRLLPSGGRIAFSPDGQALAVHNARERKIRLCDARGKPRFAFDCALCEHFVFTSDSKTLVLVDYDRVFSRFDVATGKILKAAKPLQIRLHIGWAVSPDGKTVAVVERYGNVVLLFDIATSKRRLPAPGPYFLGLSLAFSPDGRYLVSGNSGPVQVWDLATGRVASTWDSFAVGPIQFSRDGKIMTLRYQDVEWWRFPEGKKLGSFYPGPEDRMWSIALSADGKRLAAGGKDDFVRLWNTAAGKKERVLNHGAETQALTFSPDGRFLLAATCGQSNEGGKLKIWDLASATELASVEAWAEALAFLPDGRTVVGLCEDGRVWLRDGFSGALKQELPAPQLLAHDPEKGWGSKPLTLSPGGRLAAAASNTGPIVVWQPGTKPLRQLHLFPPGDRRVRAIAFSPDGRYLAATHPDGIICLFRLAERGRLPELPVPK